MIHKEAISMNKPVLAIHGATLPLWNPAPKSLFQWPIMGEEDEAAAMEVVRENKFPL